MVPAPRVQESRDDGSLTIQERIEVPGPEIVRAMETRGGPPNASHASREPETGNHTRTVTDERMRR